LDVVKGESWPQQTKLAAAQEPTDPANARAVVQEPTDPANARAVVQEPTDPANAGRSYRNHKWPR
jgi:hypothetical protein